MALTINSNLAALAIRGNMDKATSALSKSFERLSSGLRVNRSADDPGGLAMASKFTAQLRGANQAIRNANDGVSMLQVADGALEETDSALQSLRELMVQMATSTLTSSDRSDIWTEVVELVSEIDRLSQETEYNDQVLLYNAAGNSFTGGIQVGADANTTIGIDIKVADASSIGAGVSTVTASDIENTWGATSAISHANGMLDNFDNAISSVSDIRATIGGLQSRLDHAINSLGSYSEGMESSYSNIMDVDVADETTSLAKNAILQQAGAAVLAQANLQPQIVLSLLR
ncbi:MAG: flagellin FliC [Magnetococcales bacterium]|nr:flagellin FliC [Magnetococcales bacterium]